MQHLGTAATRISATRAPCDRTTTQNICGEWYFPLHSHALNESRTSTRASAAWARYCARPAGGCFRRGHLDKPPRARSRAVRCGGCPRTHELLPGESADDDPPNATTAVQGSITVASAAGFPTTAGYYIRIDNEVMRVTAGQGTTTWTVARGATRTSAATTRAARRSAPWPNDWYGGSAGCRPARRT